MTIACACIDSTGRTAIGADRQVDTGAYVRRVDTKLRRWGPWTVASTGSTVWDRFLAWVSTGIPAPWSAPGDTAEYPPWDPWSAEAFADTWYQWARDRGHGDTSRGHVWLEGSWLLARHGEIVVVGADGAVCRPARGDAETRVPEAYLAIGSGAACAMGAMHARCPGWSARDVVEAGVEAAIAHDDGCGGRAEVVCEAPELSPTASPADAGDRYRVWAIECEQGRDRDRVTYAVSAESEYGAIKRLCGNRAVVVLRVEVIDGREPQYAERRIEGYTDHAFRTDETWEYA